MLVDLRRVTGEAGLRELLEVAVADATPEETMPPVEGGPGWNEDKRRAFMAFFLEMLGSPESAIYTITVDGAVAGFMRLKRMPDEGAAETGMWLGRSHRGKGIGALAFEKLLREAARQGYARVVADTTPENVAAQGVLRRGGARTRAGGGKIYAEITIDPAYAPDVDK